MSEIMDAEDRFSEEEDTLDAILWAIHSGRLPRGEPNEAAQDGARDLLARYTRLIEERVRQATLIAEARRQAETVPLQVSERVVVDMRALTQPNVAGHNDAPTDVTADTYEHERRGLSSVDG